jgi:hypothetical protein
VSPASAKSKMEGRAARLFIEPTEPSRCSSRIDWEKSVIDHSGGEVPDSEEE